MSVIDVGGIQGAGKTTLIEHARVLSADRFKVLKRSSIIAELLGVPEGVEHTVDPILFEKARAQMRRLVASEDDCVRDVHFSSFSPKPEMYSIDESDVGKVSAIVLVQASLETLVARRKQGERPRPTDPLIVQQQADLEALAALHNSQQLNVPLLVIENEDIVAASQALISIVRTYL